MRVIAAHPELLPCSEHFGGGAPNFGTGVGALGLPTKFGSFASERGSEHGGSTSERLRRPRDGGTGFLHAQHAGVRDAGGILSRMATLNAVKKSGTNSLVASNEGA